MTLRLALIALVAAAPALGSLPPSASKTPAPAATTMPSDTDCIRVFGKLICRP